jgi:dTDP-4-amino-4,6-dideoxygalactose transaminase
MAQVERARLLRWHGLDRTKGDSFRCEQDITEVGYKVHLTDVAAAALSANLKHVPGLIHQGRMNAQCLSEWLRDTPGLTVPRWDAGSSYWLYTLLTPERDRFLAFLKERGVMASPVHTPNHRHTAFKRATHPASAVLRGTEQFASTEVAIPCGWWVSPGELHQVAEAVSEWSRELTAVAA